MSGVEASLAGAAILALAALLTNFGDVAVAETRSRNLLGEVMMMVIAGGLAVGIGLVGSSVAEKAHITTSWVQLVVLLAIPIAFVAIWRRLNRFTASTDGSEPGTGLETRPAR